MCGRSFRYFCRPKWLLRCGYIFGPELFSTLEMSFGSNSQTTSTPGTMRSFTILPHLACFTKPALWISFQSYVPVGQMTCRLEKKIRYKPICFRAAFGGEKKTPKWSKTHRSKVNIAWEYPCRIYPSDPELIQNFSLWSPLWSHRW